jgi:hypothetical protein
LCSFLQLKRGASKASATRFSSLSFDLQKITASQKRRCRAEPQKSHCCATLYHPCTSTFDVAIKSLKKNFKLGGGVPSLEPYSGQPPGYSALRRVKSLPFIEWAPWQIALGESIRVADDLQGKNFSFWRLQIERAKSILTKGFAVNYFERQDYG